MILLVVFIVLAGVIVFPALKASFIRKPDVIPETIELNSLRDALMEKRGWSLQRAEAARVEYLRFLTLIQMKPGFMLVPWTTPQGDDDLDQFWHQHILDTAKYAKDCDVLFGRMIHHNPHVVRGSGQEAEAIQKTQRLYARTFDSGEYGGAVDPIFLTGCGACSTVDTHGHAHGGHTSDSHNGVDHSGDSHSCGGHSCGGHGCGHGCGGH